MVTTGWSRRADYEQPASELAWHELGDLVQAFCLVSSAEVVTKWDVKGKFRGMLASQLRQEFPKLVQDPKAQPGFAVDDGLVAEGSDARPAYAASRQFKK